MGRRNSRIKDLQCSRADYRGKRQNCIAKDKEGQISDLQRELERRTPVQACCNKTFMHPQVEQELNKNPEHLPASLMSPTSYQEEELIAEVTRMPNKTETAFISW